MESSQNPEVTNAQVLLAVEKTQIETQEIRTLMVSLIQTVTTVKADLESLKYDSTKQKIHNIKVDAFAAATRGSLWRLEEKVERLEKTTIELEGDVMNAIQMLSTHTDAEFRQTRNELASKDHLDRKVDGLEMGIVSHIVRVDEKDTALVISLAQKSVITSSEKDSMLAMSPFPVHG